MNLLFKEDLLQFVWQYKLLGSAPLKTVSGKELQVLSPGALNADSGPDFFNAKIRLNNITLAGNIEIHLRSSDWLKHGHQHDASYNTIILHVVYWHDIQVQQNNDFNVDVLELKNHIPQHTILNYRELMQNKTRIPCASQLKQVNDTVFSTWLERLAVERLELKVKRIEGYYKLTGRNYVQTFYLCLFRNFGFKVNAEPFELLGKHLPVQLLLKHADNLLQLESLLLGTAGLLDEQFEDAYILKLQNEFEFLRHKYGLVPLSKSLFKFSRLRPANFPDLRLAQFAALLHEQTRLFTFPHRFTNYEELIKAFHAEVHPYWKNHYKPGGDAQLKQSSLGIQSIENILINTFAPFFLFYSKQVAQPEYLNHALDLLSRCKFEDNARTRLFSAKQAVLISAANSQALLQLLDGYCSKKRCLRCGIGYHILKNV